MIKYSIPEYIKRFKENQEEREKYSQYQREWRKANPEKIYKKNLQRRLNRALNRTFKTPDFYKEKATRRMYDKSKYAYQMNVFRAKKLDIPWNLSLRDFRYFVQLPCSFCGSEDDLIRLVERIDYSKGFEFDNIIPSCVNCAHLVLYYKKVNK